MTKPIEPFLTNDLENERAHQNYYRERSKAKRNKGRLVLKKDQGFVTEEASAGDILHS